jgi:chromosome segregation ATPase
MQYIGIQNHGLISCIFVHQTSGTAGTAGESREKSEELLERAKRAHQKAEEELRPQLDDAQAGVADVQQLNQHANRTDTEINRLLDYIPKASNLEVQTREAMRSSVEADQAAQNALSGIEDMVAQLPTYLDDARQIPKDVDDTAKKIASSTAHGKN